MGEPTIVYDTICLPLGVSLDQIIQIYKNTGFVLWDSSRAGIAPQTWVLNQGIRLIDIAQLSEEDKQDLSKL